MFVEAVEQWDAVKVDSILEQGAVNVDHLFSVSGRNT